MTDSNIIVSVIICTYNRCHYLDSTLDSLSLLETNPNIFEVIVVDNNSKDNTEEIVKKHIKIGKIKNLIYKYEPMQGLSFARNLGIKMARGEIITFLDDDIEADSRLIEEIQRAFMIPNVMAVGGKVVLKYESLKPVWIDTELENFLTKLDYGDYVFEVDLINKWIVGANMSFSKLVFKEYLFSTSLGRKGNILLSGEEIDLCLKIKDSLGKIIYYPKAIIKHKVPKERLNKSFFRKRIYWGNVSDILIQKPFKNNNYYFNEVFKALKILIIGIIHFFIFWTNPNVKFKGELMLISGVARIKTLLSFWRGN